MEKPHIYPMKAPWQTVNLILGFWAWFCVIAGIVGVLFLPLLIFPWTRRVLPAFRRLRLMSGEPRSYLQASEDGLVYRIWPSGEIRCKWEDIQCLKRGRWSGDALYLWRAEEIGFWEFSVNLGRKQIPLSGLIGYPGDALEDDLRNHAPWLFEKAS